MDGGWAQKELAKQTRDRPLRQIVRARAAFFHATKAISAIEASNAIVPLARLRQLNGRVDAGFGQAGALRADEYVSLTMSEERGTAYFDVLVAIAAIAEKSGTPAQWLNWYLHRWGDPMAQLEEATTLFDTALARSLDSLGVTTAWRNAEEVLADTLAALSTRSVAQQLKWLFELDRELMQDGDADLGLSIVNADAEAWSKIRLRDVALLRVHLPPKAMGYLHNDEQEARVRGIVEKFEVMARGEDRFSNWNW